MAMMLGLALATVLCAEAQKVEAEPHPVPWFVPREAAAGLFVNPPAVTSFVRLGWEIGLYEQPRNHLVLVLDFGTGTALSTPAPMRALYQHVGVIGIGYRSTREKFHWGFHLTAGALWYRAFYAASSPYTFESRVISYSEARVQFGYRFAQNFVAGGFGGYASPWQIARQFPGNFYVGGPMFGFFATWR